MVRLRTQGLVDYTSVTLEWHLAPLSTVRTSTFSGPGGHQDASLSPNRTCPEGTNIFTVETKSGHACGVDQSRRSWELWKNCLLFILNRRCVRSASLSTVTTVQLSIHVQFCLLFNRCQMKHLIVIYLN